VEIFIRGFQVFSNCKLNLLYNGTARVFHIKIKQKKYLKILSPNFNINSTELNKYYAQVI